MGIMQFESQISASRDLTPQGTSEIVAMGVCIIYFLLDYKKAWCSSPLEILQNSREDATDKSNAVKSWLSESTELSNRHLWAEIE